MKIKAEWYNNGMKIPIVIEDSSIPKYLSIFINIGAITLWPFVISRNKLNKQVLNHETIHIKQQQELLIIGFYILYVYYWIKGLMYYRDTQMAYYSIPFEMEAYDNDENLEYLDKRKFMAWWKYR